MARFAEVNDSGIVRYVLPAELAEQYPVLVSGQVEIAIDADVREGDVYENGVFRRRTEEELMAEARPAFDAQRKALFADTEWIRQRHADRVDLGVDDSVNWRAWLEYWQALRDLPNTEGFDPRTPNWPKQPK